MRFSEFLSLREKLIKEATSRVKDRQRDRAPVSQPEGEVPGELARGPAWDWELGGFRLVWRRDCFPEPVCVTGFGGRWKVE